jgi:hypothetical protein
MNNYPTICFLVMRIENMRMLFSLLSGEKKKISSIQKQIEQAYIVTERIKLYMIYPTI